MTSPKPNQPSKDRTVITKSNKRTGGGEKKWVEKFNREFYIFTPEYETEFELKYSEHHSTLGFNTVDLGNRLREFILMVARSERQELNKIKERTKEYNHKTNIKPKRKAYIRHRYHLRSGHKIGHCELCYPNIQKI